MTFELRGSTRLSNYLVTFELRASTRSGNYLVTFEARSGDAQNFELERSICFQRMENMMRSLQLGAQFVATVCK